MVATGVYFFITQQPNENTTLEKKDINATTTDTGITPTAPSITMQNITLKEIERRKGYELVVTAKESTFHHLSDTVECSSVACTIKQQGSDVAHLFSEKSHVDRMKKNVMLSGQVKGLFKDMALEGSDICYDFSTNLVSTQKTMKYEHPAFTFSANSSCVDINTQKIKMQNGVRSELLYRTTANNRRN
jgi:hypothetical protein